MGYVMVFVADLCAWHASLNISCILLTKSFFTRNKGKLDMLSYGLVSFIQTSQLRKCRVISPTSAGMLPSLALHY